MLIRESVLCRENSKKYVGFCEYEQFINMTEYNIQHAIIGRLIGDERNYIPEIKILYYQSINKVEMAISLKLINSISQ